MTVSYSQQSLLEIAAGLKVSEPANASPLATGGVNLFTITGGRVIVVALYGEVTTIIQAQATTVQLVSTPTTLGSAVNLSSAGLDLTGLEVGGHITLPAVPATATALIKGLGGYVNLSGTRLLVPPGVISVNYGAASTGAVKWDLIYVPYDAAAVVAAV